MSTPTDRRYTRTHEWCKLDGQTATVGISQFAADQLTDITFVRLPEAGQVISAGEPFGEIESVKSAGDLYSPVSGEVQAVNETLADDPGLINRDPFEQGWLIRVKVSDPAEADRLLDPAAYDALLAEES